MLKSLLLFLFVAVFCVGCDTAAKQQQAEDARRAATAARLTELGEEMQKSTRSDLTVAAPANE